jgi:hypothetical protein
VQVAYQKALNFKASAFLKFQPSSLSGNQSPKWVSEFPRVTQLNAGVSEWEHLVSDLSNRPFECRTQVGLESNKDCWPWVLYLWGERSDCACYKIRKSFLVWEECGSLLLHCGHIFSIEIRTCVLMGTMGNQIMWAEKSELSCKICHSGFLEIYNLSECL